MMSAPALAVALITLTACGSTTASQVSRTGSPARTQTSTSAPSGNANRCASASSYGLLVNDHSQLELITPSGCVAATAAMAPTTAHVCPNGMGNVLPPPVSASNTRVYYRDGATTIKSVMPGDPPVDETTVPGLPTVISSFSVSPDDRRIAVVVENGTNPSLISLRIYVEDLHGAGHHADIYSTTIPSGKGGTTLWPMGWHGSDLVLAVIQACAFEPLPGPIAWHVANSATAIRKASIGSANCVLSWWPSPSGVVCASGASPRHAVIYDWTGAAKVNMQVNDTDIQGGIAPGGLSLFLTTAFSRSVSTQSTRLISLAAGVDVTVNDHVGCLWIDDHSVLAMDAVIAYPSGAVTPLPAPALCAGRFPGAL